MRKFVRGFAPALLSVICIFAASSTFGNALENPQFTVDGLKIVEGASALLASSEAQHVRAGSDGAVEIDAGSAAGSVTIPAAKLDFEFNEAIPSWNGWVPPSGGFRIWMRAGKGSYSTPWIEAGTWGQLPDSGSPKLGAFPGGRYDVDTLLLDSPCEWVQFRADLVRGTSGGPSPKLRLLAVSFTNSRGDRSLWKKFGDHRPALCEQLNGLKSPQTLQLPFRSQVVPRQEWIDRICSPASVSVVLEHFGVNYPTQKVAEMLYDRPNDSFGVWNRSVQCPAQEGIRGYIRRFRNWDSVREEIAKGSVICASIRFEYEELTDPPTKYRLRKKGTKGHIISIDGFGPGGRVIVNNSGSKDYGHGESWRQDDLAKAWFDKGGVAYVFTGRAKH